MKEIRTLVFADLHNYPKDNIQQDLKQEYDIIFLLGDISDFYLKLISNYAIENNIPICGIVGNHDKWNSLSNNDIVDVHMKNIDYCDILIGGFSGCPLYKEDKSSPQFTQLQAMALLSCYEYVDIFLAHNSPFGINENSDNGFEGILNYIQENNPKYVLHGHQHINQETIIGNTKIIGIFGSKLLTLEI